MEPVQPRLISVDSLIGDTIENLEGERLGELKDIVVDSASGAIVYAVLSMSTFLGVGEKPYAIPWKLLTFDAERGVLMLDADKERLKKAPGFDKDHWPAMSTRHYHVNVDYFYEGEGRRHSNGN